MLKLTIVSMLALLLVACGGSEQPSESTPTRYGELLGLIPDTPETRSSVLINDYALIRELFDIPLPGRGADQQAMDEYYNYMPPLARPEGVPDFSALATAPFLSDGYTLWRFRLSESRQGLHRQYLGFDIRNENQTMVAGVPPRRMEVLYGQFDPEAFDRALSTCSGECMPPDAHEEYKGVTFYGWGEEFVANARKVLAPPVFDNLGRGGRIAVEENYVFRTLSTEGMEALIDASLDKRPSLADVEDYRLLATGIAELGAYGMFLTNRTQGFEEILKAICEDFGNTLSGQECIGVREQLKETQPMLRRYQVFATGVGEDEKGAYTALVLVHADAASAKDNVGLLPRRIEEGRSLFAKQLWSQYFDTGTMEVFARGRVLLAKLRPTEGRPPIWLEWAVLLDPLLLHEPEPGFVLPTAAPSS